MDIKKNGEIKYDWKNDEQRYVVDLGAEATVTRHWFGILDKKGREFGARVAITAETFGEPVSDDEAIDETEVLFRWSGRPDELSTVKHVVDGYKSSYFWERTVYHLSVHAERDGESFGASQSTRTFLNREDAEAAAADYIRKARKRTENHKDARGTVEDGYRFRVDPEARRRDPMDKVATVATLGGDAEWLRHPFFNTEPRVS